MKNKNFGLTLIPLGSLLLILILFLSFGDLFPRFKTKRPQVWVILKTSERVVDFWSILEMGLVQAAEDFEIDLVLTGPSKEGNVKEQIALVDQAIGQKPDVIILAAADYHRLVEPVQRAAREDIPVLTVDSYISSDDAASQIGTANFEAGGKLAHYLKENLPQDSTVGILSYVKDSSTAIDREQGFRLGIAGYLNVLPTLYNNDEMEQGARDTLSLLEQEDSLSAIVALNEVSARGLLSTISNYENSKGILFLAFDSNMDIVEGIENGLLDGTVVQKPYNMGYQSIKAAYDLVNGKIPPSIIDTGSEMVTLENLFNPVIQKLLFPTNSIEDSTP